MTYQLKDLQFPYGNALTQNGLLLLERGFCTVLTHRLKTMQAYGHGGDQFIG